MQPAGAGAPDMIHARSAITVALLAPSPIEPSGIGEPHFCVPSSFCTSNDVSGLFGTTSCSPDDAHGGAPIVVVAGS